MASIYDVAQRAGVSASTVSRVLNGSSAVNPETRRKVMAAIAELGYKPNPAARTLRTNRTGLVALIVPEITNPYFSIIAQGVQDAARKAGFGMILCNSGGNEADELDYMRMLPERRIDGFVITPPGANLNPRSDRYLEELAKEGYPVVCIGRRVTTAGIDTITVDTSIGAREAMMHLLENGHTRIAFFGGPSAKSVATRRLEAYRKALAERGLLVDEGLIFECDLTLEGGYRLAQGLLERRDRPTAIFAVNDMVAIGALTAVVERGISVPDEMAIVGFDDIPLASIVRPALTTVTQPKYDLGRLAAEHLILRIEGSKREADIVILPTRLVVRGTTLRVTSMNRSEAGTVTQRV